MYAPLSTDSENRQRNKILSSDLRSGGLNRSLLHEISMRIHWKWSRTPKPANKIEIYRETPDQPPQRPICYLRYIIYISSALRA